jgi:antitoxin (DNA-binding transcriptional repressor) of toxin-antitoxin stability system
MPVARSARRQWSQLLNRVVRREISVMLTTDGIPVAAIAFPQDLDRLHQLELLRQRDLATLRASQDGFKDEPVEDVDRQIARALAEARAERQGGRA